MKGQQERPDKLSKRNQRKDQLERPEERLAGEIRVKVIKSEKGKVSRIDQKEDQQEAPEKVKEERPKERLVRKTTTRRLHNHEIDIY